MNDGPLLTFVLARNRRRSAKAAASGFVAGQRVYALQTALREEQTALMALAGWAEDQARIALALPPTPPEPN
jgi:hypothetical protein